MNKKQTIFLASSTFNINIDQFSDFEFKYNKIYDTMSEELLIESLINVSGVVAGLEPYNKNVLNQHKNTLKVISRIGSGLDNIDLKEAERLNIKILSTPLTPVKAVVELTIAMMINLCRNIITHNKNIHNNTWVPHIGYLLSEKKIGILGNGRIGSSVIKSLNIFTDNIKYHDIDESKSQCSLQELFSTCDIISIHIPLENNHNFINKTLINVMPKGSYIINNSRGPIVNEHDIAAALDSGILAGYAADTHIIEPYNGLLLNKPNVILTPHIGSHTVKTRFDMNYNALLNCVNFLKKQFN